jgi:hypothetical protein
MNFNRMEPRRSRRGTNSNDTRPGGAYPPPTYMKTENSTTIEEILTKVKNFGAFMENDVDMFMTKDEMTVKDAKQALLDHLLSLPELRDEEGSFDDDRNLYAMYQTNLKAEEIRRAITRAILGEGESKCCGVNMKLSDCHYCTECAKWCDENGNNIQYAKYSDGTTLDGDAKESVTPMPESTDAQVKTIDEILIEFVTKSYQPNSRDEAKQALAEWIRSKRIFLVGEHFVADAQQLEDALLKDLEPS